VKTEAVVEVQLAMILVRPKFEVDLAVEREEAVEPPLPESAATKRANSLSLSPVKSKRCSRFDPKRDLTGPQQHRNDVRAAFHSLADLVAHFLEATASGVSTTRNLGHAFSARSISSSQF
jgi:hypothetical protein